MTRICSAAACLVMASVTLAQNRPEFEVASVRPSSEQVNAVNVGLQIRAAVNNGMVLPPQALRLLDGATGDRLAAPLQTVGLTLESRRAPLEVLVIDSMRRTPTEN